VANIILIESTIRSGGSSGVSMLRINEFDLLRFVAWVD